MDVDPASDFAIGFQYKGSGLFSKFRYSCFSWVKVGKLFNELSAKMTFACAVGTEEGPIILAMKGPQNLHPVALLCCHSACVTCLQMSVDESAFFSADASGCLCCWDGRDGCCGSRFPDRVFPGDVRLAVIRAPRYEHFVWLWTVGFGAFLIDTTSGVVELEVRSPGLQSLSSGRDLDVVMVGIDSVRFCRLKGNDLVVEHEASFEFRLG
jgi:hypothetical protein